MAERTFQDMESMESMETMESMESRTTRHFRIIKALAICALAQSVISICASEDSTAVCPNVVTTEIIRTVMIRTDDNNI